MKLAMLIGSPRRKNSNSKILAEKFISGYNSINPEEVIVEYIYCTNSAHETLEKVSQAGHLIIIMPLYTDCMPGRVKEFLEVLHATPDKRPQHLGFIVQSGFPESIQSEALEQYLRKYCRRIGSHYSGTVIKGGVEGIQMKSASMTKKLFQSFYDLGLGFAQTQCFDPNIMRKLRSPKKINFVTLSLFRLLNLTGITNFYWIYNLRKNKAYRKRHDQPFAE